MLSWSIEFDESLDVRSQRLEIGNDRANFHALFERISVTNRPRGRGDARPGSATLPGARAWLTWAARMRRDSKAYKGSSP
jgi:hypothetical protein